MLVEPWNTAVSLIGAVAGIATASALFFTIGSFRRIRKTEEVRLAESVFKDIRALEKDLSDINAIPEDPDMRDAEARRKNSWRSQFFNTLEWLSFLVNEHKIKDKKVIKFFKPAIMKWYDDIFVQYMGNAVTDPEEFPEFKKLYEKFRQD